MSHEGVNVVDVGRRLRIAREAAGMTQAHAAANIKVARTTLVAMEKGQRTVRFAELRPLARLYRTSVNALLRRESVYTDLVPRFRKLPGSQDESSAEACSAAGRPRSSRSGTRKPTRDHASAKLSSRTGVAARGRAQSGRK